MIRILVAAIAVSLSLLTFSCNASDSKLESNEAHTSSVGKAGVFELSSIGTSRINEQMMTDFTWTDNGKKVSLSDYGKGKIIFLNFWATWCPPCRKEIPDIIEISEEMKDELVVVGISFDRGDAKTTVEKYVAAKNIPYLNVIGNDKISAAYGGIQYIPSTFIIDKTGRIAARLDGAFSKAQFMEAIKKAQSNTAGTER